MSSIVRKIRLALVERSSAVLHNNNNWSKQSQVNHFIRRWVTQEEKLQQPRLRPAHIKKRSFGDSGYVLLVLPAAAFGLGCWQVQRRKWKLDLIDQLEKRTTAEPIDVPENYMELLNEEMLYRRVKVRGKFDHTKEIYLGPRSNVLKESSGGMMAKDVETGVNVITPFKLSDRNLTILVNRGWVTNKFRTPESRMKGQVEDEVEIVGVIRHTEKRAPFMLKDRPGTNLWLLRDVDKMAELVNSDPIMIDADYKSTVTGGPIGGQTRVSLRNEHLSYIITWYSLAAIMTYMWFKRYRRPEPPDKRAFLMRHRPQ